MESTGHKHYARIVPHHRVLVKPEMTRLAVPGQENQAEPEVILVREGEVVKAIEVVCGCGRRIRLKCVF